MNRVWMKLKLTIFGLMTDRSHKQYRKWRDRLVKTQVELGALTPERREAIHREVEQMASDFDRLSASRWN